MNSEIRVAVVTALVAVPAAAGAELVSGVSHGGDGCPAGTMAWVYNPTTETVTFTFDSFGVWLDPAGEQRPTSRCSIDVQYASGGGPMRLGWRKVQYLGYIDKPRSVGARLEREYRYASRPPVRHQSNWGRGRQLAEDIFVEDQFTGWSDCAAQVQLGIHSQLVLEGQAEQFSEMVLDREHAQARVVSYLQARPCH